jgi:Zn-dependent metalloprotease
MFDRVAGQTDHAANADVRETLAQSRQFASQRLRVSGAATALAAKATAKRRLNVYTAGHTYELPGKLSMSDHKARSSDVETAEAYDGAAATHDFYSSVFGRNSIDNRGMRIDSTVHYGKHFDNAMWNGEQIVYGDGDGHLFGRFTKCLDVIGHELTHGITQHSAALGYTGQTGSLNEHLSDAFGLMVKLYKYRLSASESDWLIGEGLFGPGVHGKAVRSMAAPGTAYDDPILGRDPQPWHMRDYVETSDDHGGVHINSGILNNAFYRAAMEIGGPTHAVMGRVWYITVDERLTADARFADFVRATIDIAGELYTIGGRIQRIIADAWSQVGLGVKFLAGQDKTARRLSSGTGRTLDKWRDRPAR